MTAPTPRDLRTARDIGAIDLAIIGLGLFGELFVRGVLVVAGNPGTTADKLRAAERLWRLGLVFFGMTCLVRGALIVKSGYVPRLLGLLLFAAGGSYLLNSFALLLSPPLAAKLFPAVLLPALVGELALCVWLLVANEALLQQRLAAAAVGGPAGT